MQRKMASSRLALTGASMMMMPGISYAQSAEQISGEWSAGIPLLVTLIACGAGAALLAYMLGQIHGGQERSRQAGQLSAQRRAADNALKAVLLDRADGAVVIEDGKVQTRVGLFGGKAVSGADDNTQSIAAALAAGAEKDALQGALDDLVEEGQPFEKVIHTEDQAGLIVTGRTVGAKALITVSALDNEDNPQAMAHTAAQIQARVGQLENGLDQLPMLSWTRDTQGRLTWANDGYVQAVRAANLAEVVEDGIELMPDQRGEVLRKIAQRAREDDETVSERHVLKLGEGEPVILEITEVPTENGSFGNAADVTAHVKATESLRQRLGASEALLGRFDRGVATFNADQRMTFSNQQFAQMLGLEEGWHEAQPSLREVLDSARGSYRLPQDGDYEIWRRELLEKHSTLNERVTLDWHLANEQIYEVTMEPHPLGGTLWIINDASKFHELARDAATASAVHKVAVSKLSEGVAVIGLDGRCRLANEALLGILEMTQEEAEGAHITEIAEKCRHLLGDDTIWQKIAAQVSGDVEARELWSETLVLTNGIVLRLSSVPLPDGATLFAFRDVTDSYEKERGLEEQNRKLQELSRLKSQFIGSIHGASHELKIPLNTIVGFSEILSQEMYGGLNERQHEYIEGIHEASNQLRQLISSIIDLAMLEADYYAFRIEGIDVAGTLSTAVEFVERNTPEGAPVRFVCPADIGELPGDAPRFREIAHTLIKAMKDEADPSDMIDVGARRHADHICLWVGCRKGFVPHSIRDIINNEFRDETMPDMRRVALGLTLVQQFIERQGGTISIERGLGGIQEAVVYRMLTDADKVRAAIGRDRNDAKRDAAE